MISIAILVGMTSALQVPSLQGNWILMEGAERKTFFINSSGQGFMGIAHNKNGGVAFRIEGKVTNGVMEGKVLLPPASMEHLPAKVVAQVLQMNGSSLSPGWIEAPLKLTWNDTTKRWKGNRGSLSVTYSRQTEKVSRLVPEENPAEMFKPIGVPDLAIEALSCETVTTNGTEAWQITAKVMNRGDAPTPDRWKVELQTAMPKESRTRTHPFSRNSLESLRQLKAGETIDVVWNTAKPTDTANRPSLAHNIVAIKVNLDPAAEIDEVNEKNNSRTLQGVSCKPQPLPADAAYSETIWLERESPDYATPRTALEKYIDKATTAEAVLCYIKMEAKRRAAESFKSADIRGSRFLVSLKNNFLKEYLAAPSPTTGLAAMKVLGNPQGAPRIAGLFGYYLYVPAGFRTKHPAMPEYLYPATHFAKGGDYAPKIPVIDGPYLVGDDNLQTGMDDDAKGGGRNWSNVMHWATGVRYGDLSKDAMRELFIGYELWHYEGWDVFGEDAINDLIGEEQGRMLGARLATGDITCEADLIVKLNKDFRESRAWVGAMLRLRKDKLDEAVLMKTVPRANIWWGYYKGNKGTTPNNAKDLQVVGPWGSKSIRQMVEEGKKPAEICKTSKLVESLIQIYQVMYECDEWEVKNGPMPLTQMTQDVVNGLYDGQFERAEKAWNSSWNWTPR